MSGSRVPYTGLLHSKNKGVKGVFVRMFKFYNNTRDVIVTFRSKVSIATRQNTLGGVKFKHPYKHPFYTLIFTV